MAFSLDDLSDVAALNKNRTRWSYDTEDALATALASGYFNGAGKILRTGDTVELSASDGTATLRVTAASAGAVTASASGGALSAGALGPGSVERVVVEKLGETVSVRDFGAVGNGDTDDLAAINAAQDYLSSVGGGTLLYPPGHYILSSAILCQSKIRHVGAGRRAAIMENVNNSATARLNDCFIAGAVGITNIAAFTGYAGTLATDRRSIALTTGGAGANFSVGEVAFLGSTATVSAGATVPEQGFYVYLTAISTDTLYFEASVPESITSPKLFKFSGSDSNVGCPFHVGHHFEIGGLTLVSGSIHLQGALEWYIHDIGIEACRNFVVWNGASRGVLERVDANYWNRAIELKLYSHETMLRDIKAHWYAGNGATTPTTPLSFGEMAQRLKLDNVSVISGQTSAAAGYIGVQYARHLTIENSHFDFSAMPAAPVIDIFDGLSDLAKSDSFTFINNYVKAGGSATRFLRTSDASPSYPPTNIVVLNNELAGTISSVADAVNLQGGDRLTILGNRLPDATHLIALGAACTNVTVPSAAGLAKLRVKLPDGLQPNTRTALGTSASSGNLGVGATKGVAAVTRSIGSATTSEGGDWLVNIPYDYVSAGTLQVMFRIDIQNGPAQVSATLALSVKEAGDNGVSSELYAGANVDVNSASQVDYTLTITATNIVAGDAIYVSPTIAIDNTGGGATVTGRIKQIAVFYQSALKGR